MPLVRCLSCIHFERQFTLCVGALPDEGCEDKFSVLMCWCDRGDGDEDDEEGEEGRPESYFGDEGQSLAVAVEEEAEDVGHLVCDEDVPWLNDAGLKSVTPYGCRML